MTTRKTIAQAAALFLLSCGGREALSSSERSVYAAEKRGGWFADTMRGLTRLTRKSPYWMTNENPGTMTAPGLLCLGKKTPSVGQSPFSWREAPADA